MTEQGNRVLSIKGYKTEEEADEVIVDSTQILQQYLRKKTASLNPEKFDDLNVEWNRDDSLNRMVAYKNGEEIWRMDFVWNADGSLNRILRP